MLDAKEALYRWSKYEHVHQQATLEKWLQTDTVDKWRSLQIVDVELTLDQYGVLAVVKGRLNTFDRATFSVGERYSLIHLHFNMFGAFRCVGTTLIDDLRFSNLPEGAVNGTQIIYGKRKPDRAEGKKILRKIQSFNGVYYSKKVRWNQLNGHLWQVTEEWNGIEVAIRDFKNI